MIIAILFGFKSFSLIIVLLLVAVGVGFAFRGKESKGLHTAEQAVASSVSSVEQKVSSGESKINSTLNIKK